MVGAVRVRGLKELQRDFRKMASSLDKELTEALIEAAEPVREEAESLALGKIRNMPGSPHWAGMRVGVSKAQGVVFMVPAAKRRGGSGRSNLAELLMERAMDPALEKNQDAVVKEVDKMLGKLAGENGFNGRL